MERNILEQKRSARKLHRSKSLSVAGGKHVQLVKSAKLNSRERDKAALYERGQLIR